MKNDSWLTNYIKKNPLQVTLQIIGVAVLILNIWLTTKLAPLAQDITLLNFKVEAIGKTEDSRSIDHDDLQIIKTKVIDMANDVGYIKENMTFFLKP